MTEKESDLQVWIDAKKRYGLTDTHIQMARELRMNPTGFPGLAKKSQERWKLPLGKFIEKKYRSRFFRDRPHHVRELSKPGSDD
jgi:hypothetical protein